ncbi:MAG: hypothetical protein L3K09_05405 [Thermoplasmata archaeon]|nr:hypothetical protein [Thermoplasmata archaeon]
MPGLIHPITANGTTDGPGGCSGPGAGLTEYCFVFRFLPQGTLGLARAVSGGTVVRPTTADVRFELRDSAGSNVTFVNVTVLGGTTGDLLAMYTPGGGWAGFDRTRVPFVIDQNQTFVLDCGLADARAVAVTLVVEEGRWGSTSVALP